MSLIAEDNSWGLLFVLFGTVALGVWLESKYKWAAKMSALVIILLLAILFSNVHLIPTKAVVYDFVWDYLLPLSLPMLLFKSDIKKICRESGQVLVAFLIGAVGTVIGAFVAYFIFRNVLTELPGLSAMMTGTYIGGSVNFAVLSDSFHVSEQTLSAATIADNLNMAIYFFVLLSIPVSSKSKKDVLNGITANHKSVNQINQGNTDSISQNQNKDEKKQLTLRIFVKGLAVVVFIIAMSDCVANELTKIFEGDTSLQYLLQSLLGNRYLWITTFSVLSATLFSKQLEQLFVLQDVGIFFIYCFIFVIGVPASVLEIVRNSPLMLVFALIIVAFNMLFTFGGGAILRMDRRILIIASNANIGGPTTAASMAIAKGWDDLVGPALLVGCLGYVIGNYLGLIVGHVLM